MALRVYKYRLSTTAWTLGEKISRRAILSTLFTSYILLSFVVLTSSSRSINLCNYHSNHSSLFFPRYSPLFQLMSLFLFCHAYSNAITHFPPYWPGTGNATVRHYHRTQMFGSELKHVAQHGYSAMWFKFFIWSHSSFTRNVVYSFED